VVKSLRDAAAIYWMLFIAFGFGGAREKPSETLSRCRALTGGIEVCILCPRVDDGSTTESRARFEIARIGVAPSNRIARSRKLHENFSFAVRRGHMSMRDAKAWDSCRQRGEMVKCNRSANPHAGAI